MTSSERPQAIETSLSRDLLLAARYYLRGRRGLIVLATVAATAGLVFNWSWLVAVGAVPILVAVLPCVAMCALGLCMNKMAGQSCSSETASARTPEPANDQARPALNAAVAELPANRPADGLEPAAAEATANTPELQPLDDRRMPHA